MWDNTQLLMKSWKRAVGCLVSFFSPLQTFLLPFFLPHLGPRNSPGTWGVVPRAGFFLILLIPSPGSLWPYWEFGSEWFFHSALGRCFNNSWLRKRGKISHIALFVFKQYNWSLFYFTTARDPQIHAVVPFCIQGSPCCQGAAKVLFLYQR